MQKKKRLQIGILFNFSSSWMGGIVYIINLVKTLNFLEDEEKPEIYFFYRKDLEKFLHEISNYPYLKLIEWNFPSMIQGNIESFILRRNIFIEKIIKNYPLDALYPLQDFPVRTKTNIKLVAWFADFQYKHYPEFFSKGRILGRDLRNKFALRNNDDLVLSSNDAFDDLTRFYKVRKNLNVHIFHFVSVIDNLNFESIDDLKTKYGLPDEYFMVSNQFHKHKNHIVLLQTIVKLKEKGIIKHLAVTGKFPDAKKSPYLAELHRIIDENDLKDQVNFLGIIPRNDQLQIMRYSQAVIQPSLFEGWSTVIEDAKSLQVPVIASNLNVNMEQLGKDGNYFDPSNYNELATILMNFSRKSLNHLYYEEYSRRIKNAAKELLNIFRPKV